VSHTPPLYHCDGGANNCVHLNLFSSIEARSAYCQSIAFYSIAWADTDRLNISSDVPKAASKLNKAQFKGFLFLNKICVVDDNGKEVTKSELLIHYIN
jgi:hypothetical protein